VSSVSLNWALLCPAGLRHWSASLHQRSDKVSGLTIGTGPLSASKPPALGFPETYPMLAHPCPRRHPPAWSKAAFDRIEVI